MRRIDRLARELLYCGVVAGALSLSGCSLFEAQIEPVPVEPEIVTEAPPQINEPNVSVHLPDLLPVAIVLTSRQPAYADVAAELAEEFENHELYDLSDGDRPPVTVMRLINDSDTGTVVAIGLRAAQSSVAMSQKPVVFSQVFNYQDHNLLTSNSRGIAAIAPLDAQIEAWKNADPTINRIGAIVGEGHDDLIAEAEEAAARHGVMMRVQVTRSDQETLYLFKRMVREIDGFWLFPDNRILSRRVLQQIMTVAERQRVPVLAPSESMLQIGATISVGSVASDIAAAITKVIRQIQAGNIEQVPPISPLTEIRVRTRDPAQVANR